MEKIGNKEPIFPATPSNDSSADLFRIHENPELEEEDNDWVVPSKQDIEQNVSNIIEQNAGALYNYALANIDLLDDWAALSSEITTVPSKDAIDEVNRFIDPILKYQTKIQGTAMPKLESISGRMDMLGSIFNFHRLLNQTGRYIYCRSILNTIQKELKKFKEEQGNSPLSENVQKLEAWIEKQKKFLKSESSSMIIRTFALAPTVVKIIAENFMDVGEKFKLGNSAAGGLVGIFSKSLGLHGARKDRTAHVNWTEELKDPVLPKGEIKNIIAHSEALREERKNAREKMNEKYKETFEKLFKSLESKDFKEIKLSLKEAGINLDDIKISKKEDIETHKNKIFEKYIDHKETMAVLTRQHLMNPVKKMVQHKHNVERKFLNFNLANSSIGLTASLILYIATITLKVLAIVGVMAAATTLLAWGGIGVFAIGLILTLAGLLLLRKYRPNLFSELLRGTRLKASFYGIFLTVQKLRLDLVKMKKLKMEWKPNNQKKEKIEALDKKMHALEESVKQWEDKINPLEERLKEASWKDFQRSIGLVLKDSKSAEKLEDLNLAGGREELNLNDNLIELLDKFLDDEHFFDQNTKDLFEKHLNIPLKTLKGSNAEKRAEIFNKMRDFFTLTEKKLVSFINTQNIKFPKEDMA